MSTAAIVRASNNLVLVSRRRARSVGSPPRQLLLLLRLRSTTSTTTTTTNEWRKHQLDKLEKKFDSDKQCDAAAAAAAADNNSNEVSDSSRAYVLNISDDDALQPMWKQMESRVMNRRSYRLGERPRGGNVEVGRTNVRRTEEDVWLKQGLYDDIPEGNENKKE